VPCPRPSSATVSGQPGGLPPAAMSEMSHQCGGDAADRISAQPHQHEPNHETHFFPSFPRVRLFFLSLSLFFSLLHAASSFHMLHVLRSSVPPLPSVRPVVSLPPPVTFPLVFVLPLILFCFSSKDDTWKRWSAPASGPETKGQSFWQKLEFVQECLFFPICEEMGIFFYAFSWCI
jgi:hypothetical protein